MSDELVQHFQLRVRRAYDRYAAVRAGRVSGMQEDKAAAMEVAKLLYHLHEHIPTTHKVDRTTIAARFPDFALIRDVADSDKHHDLRDQSRAVANAHQVEERLVVTFYRDAQGDYRHVEKRVFLKLTGGGERDAFDLLTAVMNFWIGELTRWGYIGNVKPYPVSPRPQPVPRAEADSRMGIEHMQGVPLTQVVMVRRYNDATGRIEPEDISGWQVEATLRKLNLKFDIVRINEATGETITRTVDIPDDIAVQLQHIPPELRGHFLSNLPIIQAALQETDAEIRRRMPT
jgi:hypothetical protein